MRLTLVELAGRAGVGRSTVAALETGKLRELGFTKLSRICAVLDLTVEARPLALDAPLIEHRHLTPVAGRDLTKAAIEDVIVRGDVAAWRGLVRAMRESRQVASRVREVVPALDREDPKARAFATLLGPLLRERAPAGDRDEREG